MFTVVGQLECLDMDENNVLLGSGASVAVRQFMALVRGEDVPHEPSNPWRVVAVVPSQQYCLRCCGPRWMDVVQALTVDGKKISISKCRVCGEEV